jgi:hypothetical protein
MPLNRRGSVKARLSVWFSWVTARRKVSRSISNTSIPPGSCSRSAASPRTKFNDARFFGPNSVSVSVPCGKSNAASA